MAEILVPSSLKNVVIVDELIASKEQVCQIYLVVNKGRCTIKMSKLRVRRCALIRGMATKVMGGIGKNVLGELGDIAKKTAKDTVKAGVDIAKGTVEQTSGGGDDQGQQDSKKQASMGGGQASNQPDPMMVMKQQKEAEKRKGLNRVRQELQEYMNKKKQEETHEERVDERQEEMKKEEKEQREESEREMMIRQAQRRGGGTGEMARKKH